MYAKYLLIGALLIGAGSAVAHEARGTHGGRIADAGSYHVEMVARSRAANRSGLCWSPSMARAFPAARRWRCRTNPKASCN